MGVDIKQTLLSTVEEVFETMFFSYLDLVEDVKHLPSQEQEVFMEASIELSGKETGEVHFYFPESLAHNIAANFLGISEDESTEKQVADVLGETANMSIGSLLGKLDPQNVSATLGIPTVHNSKGLTLADLVDKPNIIAFSTQHGPLLLDYGAIVACFAE